MVDIIVAVTTVAAILMTLGGSVVCAAKIWGRAEERFDGIDRSLERIESGQSAVCVAHRGQIARLRADVTRHQNWLTEHGETLQDHGDRIVRLEAAGEMED